MFAEKPFLAIFCICVRINVQECIKITTLNKCLHPRSSVARWYMKWKEGRRGLISLEDCMKTERRGLYDYLKESKEDMLSGALKENVIEEGETKEEFTKRKRDERKKTSY